MQRLLFIFKKTCVKMASLTGVPEQIIRFLLIGCANTAFAYALYAGFIFVGMHYTVAIFLSTVLGILFSFKTLGVLVFDNPDNRLIGKFFAVYTGCYFVNIGLVYAFSHWVWNNLYAAGLVSSLVVAAISFFLNKWVVFAS